MPTIAVATLLAVLAAACSNSGRIGLPTAPTTVGGLAGTGASARTEQWRLELTIREVFGTDCDAAATSGARVVDLQMRFDDDGAVAMGYGHPLVASGGVEEIAGWTMDDSFEGSGHAYEGLPCSGSALEPAGAPTTLTGYFSDDGRRFSGVEVRRYMGRPSGDIVYHVEWKAER